MPGRYRRYDPRLKNLVAESKDISKFVMLGIPKSTLRQWIKDFGGATPKETVTGGWRDVLRIDMQSRAIAAREMRRQHNLASRCIPRLA